MWLRSLGSDGFGRVVRGAAVPWQQSQWSDGLRGASWSFRGLGAVRGMGYKVRGAKLPPNPDADWKERAETPTDPNVPSTGLQPMTNYFDVEERMLEEIPDVVRKVIGKEHMSDRMLHWCNVRDYQMKFPGEHPALTCELPAVLAIYTAKLKRYEEVLTGNRQGPAHEKKRLKYDSLTKAHYWVKLFKRNRMLKGLKKRDFEKYMEVCRTLDIRELRRNNLGDPMKHEYTFERPEGIKQRPRLSDVDPQLRAEKRYRKKLEATKDYINWDEGSSDPLDAVARAKIGRPRKYGKQPTWPRWPTKKYRGQMRQK